MRRAIGSRYPAGMTFWKRFRPTPATPELSVLMVCMGNICRSPLAEAVLRDKLLRAGLGQRVRVDSAGTHSDRGSPPDPRAIKAGAVRGLDLSGLRSRRIEAADFERFDLLLAMDEDNLATLQDLCPAPLHSRVQLLLTASPRSDGKREVPDPYYGSTEGFEHVLDLMAPAIAAISLRLQRQLASPTAGHAQTVPGELATRERVPNLD